LRIAGTERVFSGLVDRVVDREARSEITVTSRVAPLDDGSDYRVFVDESAPGVARAVLFAHGLEMEVRARREPPRRAQWVQSFESDLDFCTRVLAEEGMCWFQRPDRPRVLVVADVEGSFLDDGLALDVREEAGLEVGRALYRARISRRAKNDRVALGDYDFEHPRLDLAAESGAGALELHEWPGGFRSPDEGREVAAMRLAERRAEEVLLEGFATEPQIGAGVVVTVQGAQVGAINGRWLVLSVRHEVTLRAGAGELPHRASFSAAPADRGHRPARRAPAARSGLTTAIATGPRGGEIAIDEHGRTSLLMRWDRRGRPDEHSSAPARVVAPQLAGAAFHPRVGWEQVVGFADPGAERPIALGRLYNGEQTPPAALPAGKVQTHLGTMTTPGGARGNFIRIGDDAGDESLSVQASGDYKELTDNDKVLSVRAEETRTIGGERSLFVKENLVSTVGGAYTLAVGGVRKVSTDGDYGLDAAREGVFVGAARLLSVGGDYLTQTPQLVRVVSGAKVEAAVEHQTAFTQGASSLVVGASMLTGAAMSESVSVGGAAVVNVAGPMTITCGGHGLDVKGIYTESYAAYQGKAGGTVAETFGKFTHEVRGGAKIAGADVAIEAGARLTIKAAGVTIKMTPGSIHIQGNFEGSGSTVEEGAHQYG
jgi:type VI secretion system secreted protein VgrG